MKRLIVNGDDLGADMGRNRGILEGVRAGVVTSVSVLANGPASQEAMQCIQKQSTGYVSVGLHFNISEGRPLSSRPSRLVGSEGCFLGKEACLRLLLQDEDRGLAEDVALELKAQLDWALSWGVPITHIDGHQHAHIFPAAVEPVLACARKARISWIRLPLEERPLVEVISDPKVAAEARLFNKVALEALGRLRGSGLRTPDFFCGLYYKGLLSLRLLDEMLGKLPQGITELMVHPGRMEKGMQESPFSSFSSRDRERELEVLLDPEFRVMLRKYKVRLSGFPTEEQPASPCGS